MKREQDVMDWLRKNRPEIAKILQKIPVVGPDDFKEADGGAFIGGPWPPDVVGSKRFSCSKCGAFMGLAPSGQAFVARKPWMTLLCMPCGFEQMQEEMAADAKEKEGL